MMESSCRVRMPAGARAAVDTNVNQSAACNASSNWRICCMRCNANASPHVAGATRSCALRMLYVVVLTTCQVTYYIHSGLDTCSLDSASCWLQPGSVSSCPAFTEYKALHTDQERRTQTNCRVSGVSSAFAAAAAAAAAAASNSNMLTCLTCCARLAAAGQCQQRIALCLVSHQPTCHHRRRNSLGYQWRVALRCHLQQRTYIPTVCLCTV
jgi:hypothetical protein